MIAALRAAWWTARALRAARRDLATGPLDAVAVRASPPGSGAAGVAAVLRLSRDTCLVRALVRQRYLADRGDRRDLVVGVTAPGEAFGAHAWLADDDEDRAGAHAELLRRPAP